MKNYAVIVAAGSGSRMNTAVPTQFLLLKHKPVLWYTIKAFLDAYEELHIILVLNDAQLLDMNLFAAEEQSRIQIVKGGDNRFQSVKNGLNLITEKCVVFVHDGVRCLVTPALIRRCAEHALKHGSAIPVVSATDSIRIEAGDSNYSIERDKVKIVQTPQTFRSEILLPAFDVEYNDRFTDEATVVESAGHKVLLVEGDHQNIKITRPIDLLIAEQYV